MITDEQVSTALAAFNKAINEPVMLKCERCEGRGYHHGFGETGHDPDWCEVCGGNQYNVAPGEEERAMRLALSAALTPSAGEAEPVAWRWKFDEDAGWHYGGRKPTGFRFGDPDIIEPLYHSPSASEAQVRSDPDDIDEAYEIGKRDGYSEAVQQIDQLTGGDGEYRYCTDHDPDRHTPGPAEMIQRIIDRFEVLNLLDDATKTGRDQPDDAGSEAQIRVKGTETFATVQEMLAALKLLNKWFEITGSSVKARWERVPAVDRLEIIAATKSAIARAEALSLSTPEQGETESGGSQMVGTAIFPSKEEINHLARLALEEMQREATTDPAAWIASYERVIMSYRRLALAKQQEADRVSPIIRSKLRVTDEMIRVTLAAFQSGDMDWSSQDEELMRFALEEAISELPLAKLLKASRPYVEDRLHRPDGEIDGSVASLLSKIDAALATTEGQP